MDKIDISVICPTFNEAGNLQEFYDELVPILDSIGKQYEIVFVDDGSNDDSLLIMSKLRGSDNRIKIVQLSTNVGQTAAISAGLEHSLGHIIITMDTDGQNVPTDIPRLIDQLQPDVDLVCGWRHQRDDPFLTRVLPSRMANNVIARMIGANIHDVGCGFKAFRLDYGKSFFLQSDAHRLLPALVADAGGIIREVKVVHRARRQGRSKYGLSRVFLLFIDLLIFRILSGKSIRTLRLIGGLSIFVAVIGATILGIFGVLTIVFDTDITGRPILLLGIVMTIVGLQTLFFVLLAEMLSMMLRRGTTKIQSYRVKKLWS